MTIRIGFAKEDITPPLGTPLGGYAGFRPCAGVHDPLFCKAVVLEQDGVRYALLALDLLCVDEPLYLRIAEAIAPLGITKERLIAAAIHSHSSPLGVIPGEGQLAAINCTDIGDPESFAAYMDRVICRAAAACKAAALYPACPSERVLLQNRPEHATCGAGSPCPSQAGRADRWVAGS